LNGKLSGYRRKQPARILREILSLAEQCEVPSFRAADNLLDGTLLNKLAPLLADLHREYGFTFFYETRSDLTTKQIEYLNKAGILHIQAGIESFSDHILSLMGKGTRAIRNIQFLKLCHETGILCDYNILCRIPGEKPEDYRGMRDAIPFIRHLPPPKFVGNLRLDRFSPYFQDPSTYEINDIRPLKIMKAVHAGLKEDITDICYSFKFRLPEDGDKILVREREHFMNEVIAWKHNYKPFTLLYRKGPGYIKILDRRGKTDRTHTLYREEAEIFSFCRETKTIIMIHEQFNRLGKINVDTFISKMEEKRFFFRDSSKRVIALPIRWTAPCLPHYPPIP